MELIKNTTKSNMENKHEILLGLTTTPASDWRGKVEEMKRFGIKRIALFPTFLGVNERRELYSLLDQIDGLQIPHVHLREEDMEVWEMQWFETHAAEVFNVHMGKFQNEVLEKYRDRIYIENHTIRSIPENQIERVAGICLDFQHWQYAKRSCPIVAKKTEKYAQKFSVGCCHMSAYPKLRNSVTRFFKGLSGHSMISLDEMDYLKKFKPYFPKLMSIELENSFEQQLEVKKYLEKILEI